MDAGTSSNRNTMLASSSPAQPSTTAPHVPANVYSLQQLEQFLMLQHQGDANASALMLQPQADPNDSADFGALCLAAGSDSHQAAALLLQPYIDAVTALNRFTIPLQVAALEGFAPVVQQLPEATATVDAAGDASKSALQLAAACGNTEVVQVLLAAVASVAATANEGHTALHAAAFGGHAGVTPTVVGLLLQHQANPNALADSGESELYLAIGSGSQQAVAVLL